MRTGIGTGFLALLAILAWMPVSVWAGQRFTVIEDFESGSVDLLSWQDEDINPGAWQLTSSGTHQGSAWSLRLTGNTWKQQLISPVVVDSGAVWQVAAKTSSGAKIQGIGFSNGTNTLFYSFSGTRILDIETWVPVYQGAFSNGVWNIYHIPIADDWYAFFDTLPVITSLVYVNDLDGVANRSLWIDSILDISDDVGAPPR